MSFLVRLGITAVVCLVSMSLIRAPLQVATYISKTYWDTKKAFELEFPNVQGYLPNSLNISNYCMPLGALLVICALMLTYNAYKYAILVFMPLSFVLIFLHFPFPGIDYFSARIRTILLIFGFMVALMMSDEENVMQSEKNIRANTSQPSEKK